MTSHVLVSAGENAELSCVVDANPIKVDSVKWTREEFSMETRTTTWNASNVFYLVVHNVSAKDAGQFTCVVNNGIGKEVKNTSFLLVRRKRSAILKHSLQ